MPRSGNFTTFLKLQTDASGYGSSLEFKDFSLSCQENCLTTKGNFDKSTSKIKNNKQFREKT
jgi:autotransporter translocation and assembly factor TamB